MQEEGSMYDEKDGRSGIWNNNRPSLSDETKSIESVTKQKD